MHVFSVHATTFALLLTPGGAPDHDVDAGAVLAHLGIDDPPGNDDHAGESRRLPVLYTNLVDSEWLQSRYREWRVKRAEIMTPTFFDPDETGLWTHEDETDHWLDVYTTEDYTGLICIDWEVPIFTIIRDGPEHPRFDEIVSEMRRLIDHVVSRRPLAKVGYYGLPLRQYWYPDEEWREKMRALEPIWESSSVLFPSVYDIFNIEPGRDHERYGEMVRFSLELAGDKPVVLYTYHRYHNSREYGYEIIPRSEYVNHIAYLMGDVEYEGRRPAAVVAWGAEAWYHERAILLDENLQYVYTGEPWDRVRATFRPRYRARRDDQGVHGPAVPDRLRAARGSR